MAQAVAEILGIELHVENVDVTSDPRFLQIQETAATSAGRSFTGRPGGTPKLLDRPPSPTACSPKTWTNAGRSKGCRRGRILHPLAEAGLTKSEIRELARSAGFPNCERPAAPCIATRFPPGVPISRIWIERIAKGRNSLPGRV
jgi:hypothetical protein